MQGGGKAVLLLHGLYGNPLQMHYIGRKLHRNGYTVRIPYVRGCGAFDPQFPVEGHGWCRRRG